jgi:type IV pilus assembly protein PilB
LPVIFGRGKNVEEEEEDLEIEYVLFQGAQNGKDANLAANAKLARAGLIPAKEMLTDALLRRAETIRLDVKGNAAVITLLIDGVRYPGGRMPKQQALAVTQMLKLLAGLNVSQRKQPQSGGVKAELQKTAYMVNVESTPVADGTEQLTLRVTNLNNRLETPDDLGFTQEFRSKIREFTAQKKGLVLVCGPPHSGSSTTTFGVLRTIDAYMYTLYRFADIGDRELMHVVAFEAKPQEDLATTIKRCVRVEADVIYLDPISEAETARTVFSMYDQVSMLAEFVSKDAVQGLLQLNKWLKNPKLLATGLQAIISQKLIRLLCDKCKEPYRPNPKLVAKVGLPPETKVLYRPPQPIAEPQGGEEFEPCQQCGEVGYFGRAGMYEMIEMTDSMQQLIAKGPSATDIKAQVRKEKMQTLQQDGLRLVAEGKTTLEELKRVFKSS